MVKVRWLAEGKWDQTYLSDLLEELKDYESNRQVVVVPGAEYSDKADEVNRILSEYDKVLVIITSDEESLFDADELSHNDMIIYSQYPTDKKSKSVSLWIPIGYTPQSRDYIKENTAPEKGLDWFFSGQINNDSRRQLAEILRDMGGAGFLFETDGFTQGLAPDTYIELLTSAIVAPSPWGIVVPEAFRTYEALELGVVPIPQGREYHEKLMPEAPYVHLDSWKNLGDYLENYSQRYPRFNNEVQSWWFLRKRYFKQQFMKDLGIEQFPVTVLMSTSPVVTNPSTETIRFVIETIRKQLPEAEIIIMADGVREEQKHLYANYQEYLRQLLWWTNSQRDINLVIYPEHLHQLEMTRRTLNIVNTEMVMFIEHDMPFYDRPIDWENTIKLIQSDKIKVMRYHFEAVIPEPHSYLMLDKEPIIIDKVPLIRTAQWSQRPHLIKTETYKKLLTKWNGPDANCMIEDALHGKIVDDVLENGNWDEYKIAIYAPDLPTGYCFAYHIDGRQGEDKFEDRQKF